MSKDYKTDDQVPHSDIFEYFQKCTNTPLANELGGIIAAVIDRDTHGVDIVAATLASMIAAVLNASHQSTEDVLNKAAWLGYFIRQTVGAERSVGDAVRDAMEESKDAAHH